MGTYEMHFPGFDARADRGLIRWELFVHHEVADVLPTPSQDTLCVIFRGEPEPMRWARTLAEAGFPRPRFDGPAGGGAVPDGPCDSAA